MQRLSARPHHVGSPYDSANAEWLRDQFRSFGWQAEIENFDVLFPTPKERVVELVAPTTFKAKLQEPTVPGDPTSGQHDEQLPTYNAYSIDGDVTGPLVFVNYGVPADYDELERHGISVKGAIVIAKYGGSWRGIKPKVAAEHGAVGCLIYSDPRDDGYAGGDVSSPRDRCARAMACSAAASPTCRRIPAIRSLRALARRKTRSATRSPKRRRSRRSPCCRSRTATHEPLLAALDRRRRCRNRGAADCRSPTASAPGAARVHLA